jgi:hypothetical protein
MIARDRIKDTATVVVGVPLAFIAAAVTIVYGLVQLGRR